MSAQNHVQNVVQKTRVFRLWLKPSHRRRLISACLAMVLTTISARVGAEVRGSQASTEKAPTEKLIAWNVGQGQWVTWVREKSCIHFDLGGERAPWPKVAMACAKKRNVAVISHWDWDHVAFIERASLRLKGLCVAGLPLAKPETERKRELLSKLTLCEGELPHAILELTPRGLKGSANATSRIFALRAKALIPGDSPKRAEARWSLQHRSALAKIPILILGHHGSRTSTSSGLLKRLTSLKQAVSSSRQSRYGHPHPEVARLLRLHRIPLLRTDEWGHLIFELDTNGKNDARWDST